jgi:hypothetical protein
MDRTLGKDHTPKMSVYHKNPARKTKFATRIQGKKKLTRIIEKINDFFFKNPTICCCYLTSLAISPLETSTKLCDPRCRNTRGPYCVTSLSSIERREEVVIEEEEEVLLPQLRNIS